MSSVDEKRGCTSALRDGWRRQARDIFNKKCRIAGKTLPQEHDRSPLTTSATIFSGRAPRSSVLREKRGLSNGSSTLLLAVVALRSSSLSRSVMRLQRGKEVNKGGHGPS